MKSSFDVFAHAVGELLDHISLKKDNKCRIEEIFCCYVRSDKMVDIPSVVLVEIATLVDRPNREHYEKFWAQLWKSFKEYESTPKRLRKALVVLEYVLLNCNRNLSTQCNEVKFKQMIKELAENYNRYECEGYEFSKNVDCGSRVRKIAGHIYLLLHDEKLLRKERNNANALSIKLSQRGIRSKKLDSVSSDSLAFNQLPIYSDTNPKAIGVWDFGGKDHIKHCENLCSNQQESIFHISKQQKQIIKEHCGKRY